MSDWFTEQGRGSPIDVDAFFDSSVGGLLAAVVETGVLVGIWRTSDGGAIGISVTRDGQRRREYFRESVDAADWLLGARNALSGHNGQGQAVAAPPGPRKRTRRA